jgi:hypothetical protein
VSCQNTFTDRGGCLQVSRRGQLRANSFVRLRRLFVEGKPLMEIEDLGSADEILNKKRHLREGGRYFHSRGIRPVEDGWGGWLGRYQAALATAFGELESGMRAKEALRGGIRPDR